MTELEAEPIFPSEDLNLANVLRNGHIKEIRVAIIVQKAAMLYMQFLTDQKKIRVAIIVQIAASRFINAAEPPEEDKLTNKVAWFFATINFILEIPTIVFEQLVSTKHPIYAFTVMLMSALTVMICIFELIWKGKRGRYRCRWGCKGRHGMPWFYCPLTDNPFGTFWELLGFASAVSQLIIITINYLFIRRHLDGPIKMSILPLILAFGLLCSKFLEKSHYNFGRNHTAQHGVTIGPLDEIHVVS